jgi:hypothetical protein
MPDNVTVSNGLNVVLGKICISFRQASTKCIRTYSSLSVMAAVSVNIIDFANTLAVAPSLAIAAAAFLLQMVSTLKQKLVNVSLLTKERKEEVGSIVIMLIRPRACSN